MARGYNDVDGMLDEGGPASPRVAAHPPLSPAAGWVRAVVEDLLLWRRPLHTGLWLITLVLVFFLVIVSEYSILTLLSYLVLIQVGGTAAAMKGAPFLKTVGLLRPAFEPKHFAAQRQAFTSEELLLFSRGTALIVYEKWMLWNEAMTTRDAKKVVRMLVFCAALIVAGLVTSLDKTLFALTLVAFFIPKVYDSQHVIIDELVQILWERFELKVLPLYDRIAPVVNFFLLRLEPLLGTFDP